MATASRPRAKLGTTKRDVPGVQARAMAMYDAITANVAMFASPTITMVAFLALITALAVAQQRATSTRAKGSATLRNTKRDAVWTVMETLRAYVQALADVQSAEAAAFTIEAAGLLVGAVQVRQKAVLTAILTPTPGVVHLEAYASVLVGPANAAKNVTFNWQVSTSGMAWTDLRSTPHARTDVVSLTLMTTYSFRVSVTIGKVTGSWSQSVEQLVH